MEKTRIVEIDGVRYQLAKLSANEGSYIHWRMMGAILAQQQDGQQREQTEEEKKQSDATTDEERAKMLVTLAFMRGLSFEDVKFAQRAALRAVSRMEYVSGGGGEHPIPIMTGDGRFVPAEIEEDSALVSMLTVEALAFSLAPFFSKSRSVK